MNESFVVLCQLCSRNSNINVLNLESIDWQSVWELALRHRVVPIMADRIKQLGISVPDDIVLLIEDNIQKNLFKGMSLAAELVRLSQLFKENEIQFLAFKGIALNKLMNLELHQRHNGDMDLLLIEFDDIKKADKLLRGVGYQRLTLPKSLNMNTKQTQCFSKYEKDIIYFHPQKNIRLELHFKLFISYKTFPVQTKALYRNKSQIQIGVSTIPVMCKNDHLNYLLVHGAFSRWFRLKWMCDIPLIGDNGKDYLSPDFFQHAKSLGIERMVVQGLCLTHELLNMPISNEIKQNKWENNYIIQFAKNNLLNREPYTSSLLKKISFWSSFILWYLPALRKDLSYKADHLKSYLTRISDWEVMPLPAALFWLYYPLRPFLWLKRQF